MEPDSGKQKKGQALAVNPYKGEPCNLTLPAEWAKGQCEGQFRTSLSIKTKEGRAVLLRCLDGDVKGLDTQINVSLDVVGMTCHPISIDDDETGEKVVCVRTVLHTTQGDLKCVSAGVLRSLNLISGLMGGPPPWDPPMRVIPRRVPTSGGRSRYMLELVE